jgi:hypothetical protein
MSTAKGGRVNPINTLLNKWAVLEAHTANRLRNVKQTHQPVMGHPFHSSASVSGKGTAKPQKPADCVQAKVDGQLRWLCLPSGNP